MFCMRQRRECFHIHSGIFKGSFRRSRYESGREFGHVDMSGYSLEKRVVKVDEALALSYDMHAFALKLYMYYLYTQSETGT